MTAPAVTVLIDTYNHERFIEQAIASVLDQDFPAAEMEILVIDDGSTDRTPEIVRKFAPRVRLISKLNGGQASAFNAGIPEARAGIIAFLDGDDWWKREKLTRVVEAMSANPSVGIVGHGIITKTLDGREESLTLRDGHRFRADTVEGATVFRTRRAFLGTSRMTIRTDLLRRIGKVPEAIEIEADEYLFTLAAVLAGAVILPETLTYYRIHDANAYQMAQVDAQRSRRKQRVIAALARSLDIELERNAITEPVRRAITGIVQAEADQLRLAFSGGWPWETVKTEWALYRILHPDAPFSHRMFKLLSLSPFLVIPPRIFYRLQRSMGRNESYLKMRKRLLPIPGQAHLEKGARHTS